MDGFITEKGRIKSFSSMQILQDYAKSKLIRLHEEESELCIDTALEWLKERKFIDCSYFNFFWNTIADIANSLDIKFCGNKRNKYIDQVYNKLLYGCNPPALRGDGEMYIPRWSKKEIRIFSKVIKDGLRIIQWWLI
jgi:hypothetical protein